jgi:hypothetical protein
MLNYNEAKGLTFTTRNLIISGHIISGQRIVAANDHVISGHF